MEIYSLPKKSIHHNISIRKTWVGKKTDILNNTVSLLFNAWKNLQRLITWWCWSPISSVCRDLYVFIHWTVKILEMSSECDQCISSRPTLSPQRSRLFPLTVCKLLSVTAARLLLLCLLGRYFLLVHFCKIKQHHKKHLAPFKNMFI